MEFIAISILVLFLQGVASSRHHLNNWATHSPITKFRENFICADLCASGLGGDPCGDQCLDGIPELPTVTAKTQSQPTDVQNHTGWPRQKVCPVLCDNRLGYPLCDCNYTTPIRPFSKVDYFQICSNFCTIYNHQLYGCSSCYYYKNMTETATKPTIVATSALVKAKTYDWNEWCVSMCQAGEGGSACYCDLLPLALTLKTDP